NRSPRPKEKMKTIITMIVRPTMTLFWLRRNQLKGLKAITSPRVGCSPALAKSAAGVDSPRYGILWESGELVQNGGCSESVSRHNSIREEEAVAARKKQPTPTTRSADTDTFVSRKRPSGNGSPGGGGKFDLVIVESPAKAKTINKYLGGN